MSTHTHSVRKGIVPPNNSLHGVKIYGIRKLYQTYTHFGNSLVVQWLELGAFTARAWVQFLTEESRPCRLCGTTKTKYNPQNTGKKIKDLNKRNRLCSWIKERNCVKIVWILPNLFTDSIKSSSTYQQVRLLLLFYYWNHQVDSKVYMEMQRAKNNQYNLKQQKMEDWHYQILNYFIPTVLHRH